MNFKLSDVLFGVKKKVSILDGITTGMVSKETGAMCDSHKGQRAATMSTAVFFIKALELKELALAYSSADNALYGELNHKTQTGDMDEFKFLIDKDFRIQYVGEAPDAGNPYTVVPIVASVMIQYQEVLTAAQDVFRSASIGMREKTLAAFRFCDAFYHLYAKTNTATEYEVDEKALAIDTVKESCNMGHMEDLSKAFTDLPIQRASVFGDVKKRTRKKSEKKEEEDSWAKMLKEIKAGKYWVGYNWDKEQQQHIPPMSYLDTFIPSEEFYEILRKISFRLGDHMVNAVTLDKTEPDDIKNDIVNILLYGDPGSGKTALVHALAAATGMPLYSIKFNEDSEDDVFEGKNKIVEGKISFVETEFLKGFEKGGIVLMEEINLGRANMLTSVMNQALEYPFYVEKNGYEKVVRHPIVAAFATMNLDTDGTMTLNSAMAQRFNNKYMVDEPTGAQFKERLCALGFPQERVDYVYGVYAKIRTYLKETESRSKFLKELSIRQCIAALQDMEEGTAANRAVFNTMYGALCIKNRKLAEAVKTAILMTYPDYMGE